MNVNVSNRIVSRVNRNGRVNSSGSSVGSNSTASNSTGIVTIPKVTIPFNSALPTIANYQSIYASIHGNQPSIILMIITANGRYQSQREAQFTLLTNTGSPNDLIDTIFFDLGNPETGYIILQ